VDDLSSRVSVSMYVSVYVCVGEGGAGCSMREQAAVFYLYVCAYVCTLNDFVYQFVCQCLCVYVCEEGSSAIWVCVYVCVCVL